MSYSYRTMSYAGVPLPSRSPFRLPGLWSENP